MRKLLIFGLALILLFNISNYKVNNNLGDQVSNFENKLGNEQQISSKSIKQDIKHNNNDFDLDSIILKKGDKSVQNILDYEIVSIAELGIDFLSTKYSSGSLVAIRNGNLRIMRNAANLDLQMNNLATDHKFTIVNEISLDSLNSINSLDSLNGYWEPDFIMSIDAIIDDPNSDLQWPLDRLDMLNVWDEQTGSENITIAILDTGVDYNHPDLIDNFLDIGYDFANDDNDVMDGDGHGTHVAGTISAGINNTIGIAGMTNISFFSQKILNNTGSGFYSDAIDAIYDAVNKGADIISNSWGGDAYSSFLEDAVNYATDQGVVFVASAGNDATSNFHYPASLGNAIAVSATASNDQLASYSNYGNWVDISAPGSNVYSTLPGSSYGYSSGTSMATPHVSAVFGLIWSHFPDLTRIEIENLVLGSAEDLGIQGYDIEYGYGLVSSISALTGLTTYDIDLVVTQTEINSLLNERSFDIVIKNIGYSEFTNPEVDIYIDDFLYLSPLIGTVLPGNNHTFSISIEDNVGFNLSVVSKPYLTETKLNNNNKEVIGKYSTIHNSLNNEFSGGIIPLELIVDEFEQVSSIEMILNNKTISSVIPTQGQFFINFPVFNNGSNQIKLITYWSDSSFFINHIDIESINVNSIFELETDDEINWKYEYNNDTVQFQFWKVIEFVNTNQVNLSLSASEYNSSNLIWEEEYYAVIDLSSGYIHQTNTPWQGNHFLWLSQIKSYEVGESFGSGSNWNEFAIITNYSHLNGEVLVTSSIDENTVMENLFPTGLLHTISTDVLFGILLNTTIMPKIHNFEIISSDTLQLDSEELTTWNLDIKNSGEFAEELISISVTGNSENLPYQVILDENSIVIGDYIYPNKNLIFVLNLNQLNLGNNVIDIEVIFNSNTVTSSYNFEFEIEVSDVTNPVVTIENNSHEIYDNEILNLIWSIDEFSIAEIIVYQDEIPIEYDYQENLVSVVLDDLETGNFEFRIEVIDSAGNTASNIVFVSVIASSMNNSASDVSFLGFGMIYNMAFMTMLFASFRQIKSKAN